MKALKNFVLTGIAASVIALSGCQIFGGNENETPDPYKGRITQSADWYANQARNSSGEQRFKWKMKQIRKYIAASVGKGKGFSGAGVYGHFPGDDCHLVFAEL